MMTVSLTEQLDKSSVVRMEDDPWVNIWIKAVDESCVHDDNSILVMIQCGD